MIVKTHASPEGIKSEAVYSECLRYRYRLTRDWKSRHKKRLVFIMLNPSTATELANDPTVARCQQRAMTGEYRGFVVLNLFAFRATDPKRMKNAADPVGGHKNTAVLKQLLSAAKKGVVDIICAWGLHGAHLGRNLEVLAWFQHYGVEPAALKVTKGGHPAHPLYLSYELNPVPLGQKCSAQAMTSS